MEQVVATGYENALLHGIKIGIRIKGDLKVANFAT